MDIQTQLKVKLLLSPRHSRGITYWIELTQDDEKSGILGFGVEPGVPVTLQRNSRESNAQIKAGEMPPHWT